MRAYGLAPVPQHLTSDAYRGTFAPRGQTDNWARHVAAPEPRMSRVRFDLHLHTEFSPDCDTALTAIEPHCLARGIDGVAVTDHNTIEGALRLRDMARS